MQEVRPRADEGVPTALCVLFDGGSCEKWVSVASGDVRFSHETLAASFVELLKERESRSGRVDVGDALEWFISEVESELEYMGIPQPRLGWQGDTQAAADAAMTHIQNSEWYGELKDIFEYRLAAAQDLRARLGDFNQVRLFRTLVSWPVNTGQVTRLEDLVAEQADKLKADAASMREEVSKGTRGARPKPKHPKTSHLDLKAQCGVICGEEERQLKRKQDAAWARGMLKCMQAWYIAREKRCRGIPRLCAGSEARWW